MVKGFNPIKIRGIGSEIVLKKDPFLAFKKEAKLEAAAIGKIELNPIFPNQKPAKLVASAKPFVPAKKIEIEPVVATQPSLLTQEENWNW